MAIEKMSIEQVKKIMKAQGEEITDEQAREILTFVYTMAEISVAQVLREVGKNDPPGEITTTMQEGTKDANNSQD